METQTVAAALRDVGFRVEHDRDAREWARLGPDNPRVSLSFRAERLVVATKAP
jgi:hypothetical protein